MPTGRASTSALRAFLASESAGGLILIAAATCALLVANSPLGAAYRHALTTPLTPALSDKLGPMTAHLWINDGLMAVFFLFVGLEIKRELVDGRLATWPQRRLPIVAAIAGMAIPAGIYLLIAGSDPRLAAGWAISAATDIAFAMAVMGLLGSRAPTSLKLFLVTVAIVDDIGAVAIIALFYSSTIALPALLAAAAIFAGMMAMNRMGLRSTAPYLIGFALLWYAVLLSGVHATVAGVVAAFAIPIVRTPGRPDSAESTLHRLEHALDTPVAFVIVPLFGFANAGVDLSGLGINDALSPLPLGIAAGLFVGKQVGILGAVWLAVRSGFAAKPRAATWTQLYGVALLCGIGFTMSLFIGDLAFADPALVDAAKIGTLGGSLLAAFAGYGVLRLAPLHRNHARAEAEQAAEISGDGDVAASDYESGDAI